MKLKQWMKALTTAMITISLVGCGTTIPENSTTEVLQESDDVAAGSTKAMGRYVEQVIDASQIEGAERICQLEDGTLMCLSTLNGISISKDYGQTWEPDDTARSQSLIELAADGNYIHSLAAAPNGSIAVMYSPETEDDEMSYELDFTYMMITADGEEKQVELSLTEEELFAARFYFSRDNRLFIPVIGGNTIYEVNQETGEATTYLTTPESISQICFLQDKMILSGDGIYFYDMTKQVFVEDSVLTDFISQNYGQVEDTGAGYNCYIVTDNECIYVAGQKGLYRHVFEGSVMEQVVDGNLSTFGSPSARLYDALIQQEAASQYPEFMMLFAEDYADVKLIRYVYDEEMPTVPDENLTVYSLVENKTIKQAIAMYQSENPQLYIQYQVGTEEENGITREDALRNLTTQLMAGSGPDILVLDEMPYKTYQSKGILADISDVIAGREEAYFSNLFAPYQEEDALYAIPCEVQLPVVLGKEEYAKQITGLESIADCLEEIEKEFSGQSQIFNYSADGLMKLFSMLSEPQWTNADGQLQEQAVERFLTVLKRIYEVQMRNAKDEDIALYMENQDTMENASFDEYLRMIYYLDVLIENKQIQFGTIGGAATYQSCLSVSKNGGSDVILKALPEQEQKIYLPYTIVGVNAASTKLETATDFVAYLLGTKVQNSLFKGFSVNREALAESFVTDEQWKDDEGVIYMIDVMNGDGTSFTMSVYEATEEEQQALITQLEEADTPYLRDDVLETAVIEEGSAYLEGRTDLATAMAAIRERVQIYLSE